MQTLVCQSLGLIMVDSGFHTTNAAFQFENLMHDLKLSILSNNKHFTALMQIMEPRKKNAR